MVGKYRLLKCHSDMRTAKELSDELDAEDRLYARGYSKIICDHCKGSGFPKGYPTAWTLGFCPDCGGAGYIWKAPKKTLTPDQP